MAEKRSGRFVFGLKNRRKKIRDATPVYEMNIKKATCKYRSLLSIICVR